VDWREVSAHQKLSEPFIIKMKEYINFDKIPSYELSANIINNCYEFIKKDAVKFELKFNGLTKEKLLPEARLYYEIY